MLEKLFIHGLKMYFVIFFIAVLILLLWYYWRIYIPYSNFASCRLEHRILYWVLTRQEINSVAFRTLIEEAKKHESDGMYVAWIGVPVVVAYGEDILKLILNEPAAINKAIFYKLLESIVGKRIFLSNGDTWKKQRKQMQPAFYASAIKLHAPLINRHAEALVRELSEIQNHETDDIVGILSKWSLRIIYESSVNSEEVFSNDECTFLVKSLELVMEFLIYRLFSPWLYSDFLLPLFPHARKVLLFEKLAKEQFVRPKLERAKENMIARQTVTGEAKKNSDNDIRKQKTFGEILIQQHLQDPSFTMEQLISDITLLVTAGFDTIIHSMKFCLMLLGLDEDVQDNAYKEILSLKKDNVQYEDLQDLIYLDCVIKESLRLYPVPIIARNLESSLRIGKHVIPKDTTVVIFSYMLHRNPEIYPNPEKFDPLRFMEENSRIKPWNHIPFSEGIRNCIGKRYAMMEMKILLIHILRNFKIVSLIKREDLELKWDGILDCHQKLRMKFVPRHHVPAGKLEEH